MYQPFPPSEDSLGNYPVPGQAPDRPARHRYSDGEADEPFVRVYPDSPTPWVSAEELQPAQRVLTAPVVDEVDEASMGSFPCSDPPSFTTSRA